MLYKSNNSVDSFTDRQGRIWVRNEYPNKPWTRFIDEIAADQKSDDSKSRSFHTEIEAQREREASGIVQKSRDLLQAVSSWLRDAGGDIGSMSDTCICAVQHAQALLIYTQAGPKANKRAIGWKEAGGFAYHVETIDGLVDWLSSLPFSVKANQ